MKLSDRLKDLMSLRGVRTSTMAKDLGITTGHITDILKGRITMPRKHLSSISSYLDVSEVWLMTGVGGINDAGDFEYMDLYKYDYDNPTPSIISNVEFRLSDVDGRRAILVDDRLIFPIDVVVVVSMTEKGDGLYLTRLNNKFFFSHKRDDIVKSEWSNIPNKIDDIELVDVLGKIECVFTWDG